ncbi:MAG: alkaline phosphatase [Muribaculaceae bacterium]|nr:alkaline phosphatase [Muribaculaceae bacterium]
MKRLFLSALAAISLLSASAASPKYIFYFIGDGMGMGPVMSALNYKRLVHPEQQPMVMTSFPVASFCQTWSASTPVTDSAAAGTALSTGHKTKNGMLGMDADTVSVTSVARYLKDEGWGVGVLTTVAPDDATPGAFYAHVPARSQFYDIDIQAANSGYDFLAGAAWRGTTDKQGNPTDVMEVFESNGYKTVYGTDGLKTINGYDKVVVLGDPRYNANNNDLSYTIDSIVGAIALPDLTQAALEHLVRVSPDRFFMMVEGGNIDHALHANDGGAATKEVLNFDQAIAVAYNFYLQHPDETLIVITADHDTGGLTVGNGATKYAANLHYIDHQKISKERFSDYCKALLNDNTSAPSWPEMEKYLSDNFGFWRIVPLTDGQTTRLHDEFDNMVNKIGSDEKTLYASFNQFAVTVFSMFNDAAGYGFTTTSHTGNPVPVFAVGDGAENFSSLNNNVDIPGVLLKLATGKTLK